MMYVARVFVLNPSSRFVGHNNNNNSITQWLGKCFRAIYYKLYKTANKPRAAANNNNNNNNVPSKWFLLSVIYKHLVFSDSADSSHSNTIYCKSKWLLSSNVRACLCAKDTCDYLFAFDMIAANMAIVLIRTGYEPCVYVCDCCK